MFVVVDIVPRWASASDQYTNVLEVEVSGNGHSRCLIMLWKDFAYF